MVFETVALSVITLLLFLLLLTRKAGHVKLLLGCLTALAALASLTLYLWALHQSGGATQHKSGQV